MKSPIIEKNHGLEIAHLLPDHVSARMGVPEEKVITDYVVNLLHSFALELAEGVEGKKKDMDKYKTVNKHTGEEGYTGGGTCRNCERRRDVEEHSYNEALSHAATFIREAVKRDE